MSELDINILDKLTGLKNLTGSKYLQAGVKIFKSGDKESIRDWFLMEQGNSHKNL